jgi:peptide/nickel transport system ATP-binding protein/oligopeptide transport system ATP-binding protein
MNEDVPLVKVENLKVYYPLRDGVLSRVQSYVRAVDGVSLEIWPRETLGLVGESGCGKSTLGRAIMGLEKCSGGKVFFNGGDITNKNRFVMGNVWKKMQMVFQDPYSSLNPRKTAESALAEILRYHGLSDRKDIDGEIDRLFGLVGLRSGSRRRFPHEFSGGQRQRVSIARALSVKPSVLICDEVTSALDVSIQAQILSLFRKLRGELGLTCLFITHGLGAVKYLSDRVAVMYLGKITELASKEAVFADPRHPYTKVLFGAYPDSDPRKRGKRRSVPCGQPPAGGETIPGCRFHPRCPLCQPECVREEPELEGEGQHKVACHFAGKGPDEGFAPGP